MTFSNKKANKYAALFTSKKKKVKKIQMQEV